MLLHGRAKDAGCETQERIVHVAGFLLKEALEKAIGFFEQDISQAGERQVKRSARQVQPLAVATTPPVDIKLGAVPGN